MRTKRKVAVVVASRANYGRIRSAMEAIEEHDELALYTIAAASALLDKYGDVSQQIEADCFRIVDRISCCIQGD